MNKEPPAREREQGEHRTMVRATGERGMGQVRLVQAHAMEEYKLPNGLLATICAALASILTGRSDCMPPPTGIGARQTECSARRSSRSLVVHHTSMAIP